MRAAPPVNVQCGGGLLWRAVHAALTALAAAVLVWWALALLPQALFGAMSVLGSPLAAAATTAAVAALAGGVAWRVARQLPVRLAWDGQRWSADSVPGALEIMIDLNSWMLLRLRTTAPDKAKWLAVSAHDAGPAWHAVRTAAHARNPAPARRARAAEQTAD